jgi:NhaA family Na+:H+ antiporter
MAADIAFAVAILALLGGRVPSQLRIFLLTFAIADDVGSILVIAIYYTAHFSLPAMGLAIAILGLMLAMRWLGFHSTLAYLLPAVVFWAAMLKSGVHATIAGVILGAITPAKSTGRKSTFVEAVRETRPDVRDSLDPEDAERNEIMLGRIEELARQTESPLERLERMVHPSITVQDMGLPGYQLHPLKGEFARFWSVSVSGNWRIIFRFQDGSAYDVDLIDYH